MLQSLSLEILNIHLTVVNRFLRKSLIILIFVFISGFIYASTLWAFDFPGQSCNSTDISLFQTGKDDGFFHDIAQLLISIFGYILRLMVQTYCKFANMLGFNC